jgi:hypothetical protein
VCPWREAHIAQVHPAYFKSKLKQIMMITGSSACKSALLARSSASVSVCPITEAHIEQVDPSYFHNKVKSERSNYDDNLISHMNVSFVGQKQRECLSVSLL